MAASVALLYSSQRRPRVRFATHSTEIPDRPWRARYEDVEPSEFCIDEGYAEGPEEDEEDEEEVPIDSKWAVIKID